VIADVLMPLMDGFEFVRTIRADPDVMQTRVMFYSATYHEAEARELAKRCGVEHFLTKPAAPETILHVVSEALNSAMPLHIAQGRKDAAKPRKENGERHSASRAAFSKKR
jgi:CheY-like chemotaxis protein